MRIKSIPGISSHWSGSTVHLTCPNLLDMRLSVIPGCHYLIRLGQMEEASFHLVLWTNHDPKCVRMAELTARHC